MTAGENGVIVRGVLDSRQKYRNPLLQRQACGQAERVLTRLPQRGAPLHRIPYDPRTLATD